MTKEDVEFISLLDKVAKVLIIQPDRPDGDSLASALFLEDVLTSLGKQTHLYCAVNIPEYIRFIPGWDRVDNILPSNFDMSILVDNAALALLENIDNNPDSIIVKTKPFVVADHHSSVECDIPFATLNISKQGYASAGEMLYQLFKDNGTELSLQAKNLATQSILSDTLGLTNQLASAQTYRRIADMIDDGVNRPALEEARRELSKMDLRVFKYKAELMARTELFFDGNIAICVITEDEAYDVGTLYNPGPLILSEMLMIKDLQAAIAIKTYHNKATIAIRCTDGNGIADKLATSFGGGGHPYAAGFRVEQWDGNIANLKRDIITAVGTMLK